MPSLHTMLLALLMVLIAAMYAAVGQAGASGYLAAMALLELPPDMMRTTALILNLLVSVVSTYRYIREGLFRAELFWPFIVTSIPMAFVGGWIKLKPEVYRPLVSVVLIYAAYRLVWSTLPRCQRRDEETVPLPPGQALGWGAALGLLAGITGIGGGIFLAPLLHLKCWAKSHEVSALSSAFILVNSTAGLLGQLSHRPELPTALPLWAMAVLFGGYLGAAYGARTLNPITLKRLLAGILVFSALRMVLG